MTTFFAVIVDPTFDYISQGTNYGQAQPIIIEARFAKLGDRVWLDANANGAQDAGEAGVAAFGALVGLAIGCAYLGGTAAKATTVRAQAERIEGATAAGFTEEALAAAIPGELRQRLPRAVADLVDRFGQGRGHPPNGRRARQGRPRRVFPAARRRRQQRVRRDRTADRAPKQRSMRKY